MEDKREITIKTVIEICGGTLIQGNTNLKIKSASTNTKTITSGEVFFAIDKGNEYIEDAIKNGAIACIVEKNIDENTLKKHENVTFVKVKNSIEALQELAKYKREQYNIPVIAITGSVGKTSTKDIIANVVAEKYNVLKTEGNFNNHIGLPLTILKLENHEAIVVEMGMNHLREIANLTNIAKPTIAVITNVGTSHIGILGSRENILKAKLEILEGLQENAPLIINFDNDLLNKWEKEKQYNNTVTYGIEGDAQYKAYNISTDENKSTYNIKLGEKKYEVQVPVSGNHFIYNSLAAIGVGKALNIENEKILNGIKNFELTKKRMEIKDINGATVINDAYNASYESVKYALEYLNSFREKRKIAVLGDMFELGEYAKELHEKVGEEANKNNIDILITVGENSKHIGEKATNVREKYILGDNPQAIKKLKEIMRDGDVILLKASNGMKFGEILEGIGG